MKREAHGAPTIRAAEPSEAGMLTALALRSKAHWGYAPEFMLACREELTYTPEMIASPRCRFAIVESGGTCVGFYALVRSTREETELEALFVEPDYIGRGYGRALVEHAKASARAGGASRLIVQGDPNAMPFYEAAGGVLIGRKESGSIPGRLLPLYAIDLLGEIDALTHGGRGDRQRAVKEEGGE